MDFTNRIKDFWKPNGNSPKPMLQFDKQPTTALEERQQLLAHHVRLVVRGMSNGLCVYGSKGGLGKTRVVLETLREQGIRPVLLTGHCTPLSLYTNLYQHQDKIIFLDDADSLFRNPPALGILRSALWGQADEKRLVTYNSSQLTIPSSFHFSGRIIFTANVLPRKNHAFQAVLSRVDQFELDASNDEVIEMMTELAQQGFEDLSPIECIRVVIFISEFASTRELSLRLSEPSYRKFIYAKQAGIDWRDLVQTQLEEIGTGDRRVDSVNNEIECLQQVMREYPESVQDHVEAWRGMTKKSRATFFRLKKTLLGSEGTEPNGDQ